MAIIVLLTLVGTLPAIFSLRITQRKCSRCTPRANYARHPARSSTTKATFIVRLCAFPPRHYKILVRWATSALFALLLAPAQHRENAFNELQKTRRLLWGEEFICSAANWNCMQICAGDSRGLPLSDWLREQHFTMQRLLHVCSWRRWWSHYGIHRAKRILYAQMLHYALNNSSS